MQNDLIIISDYCDHCHIEPDFVMMLGEDGLIDVEVKDNVLYYDLSINIAGIDAIRHLLERVESMQDEIRRLRNELQFYRRL